MKKIFAIALAVVMVLSMASAFAYSTCATWNPAWNCPTDDVYCGQGKVEVIPYVKVNTACGWEYQVSDCASAIRSGEVYFAVRLTVDAFPDAGWWSQAWIDFETDGLFLNETIGYAWTYSTAAEGRNGRDVYDFADLSIYDDVEWDGSDITNASWDGIDPLADEEKVYYLTPSTAIDALTMNNWVDSEAAGFDIENVVFTAVVDEAVACGENPEYSVCATLYSEYDGWTFAQPFVADRFHDNFFRVGDYVIGFNAMGGFDRKGNLVSGE
ncbi:MAG: hypothetical protein IKD01_02975, partial [Oscillospiraceae bacterium]|nr:hypothetical protein [Oscillospiraceae bacterium]